ncbi:MAG TPA: filamentous hemagglutinin N-terminal domain-containing protein, partial [Deltaproteobacteria bacterium]|nr:filamentous hemagglutinin N-terminal domain-containing protein [Deltaproteobacteria bacterium]
MIRKMKRQWEREYLKRQVPAILACLLYFGASLPAWAAPTGGVITAGSATISSSGVTTTINQASNKAAINWQSFGIAKGETVHFVQPSASSIALNRVIGSDASAIYGTLSANGQVFLINPNGILFAPGAQVNVAGLVASTLNISDSDFLNGNYRFSKDGQAGSVINQGNITASNGYVAFLGPQVKNEGIIAAKVIGMTAGDKVSLDFNGDNLLKLTVDTIAAGASSSNSGSLLADGGTVLMSTGTKDALLSTVVNNSGLIQARTVNNISGTIILEGGSANISGTLDASAPTGGNGGFIETSGASVTMAPDLHVTTLASQGQTGTWLIDPTDYTIGTGPTGMNYWNNETLGTALASSDIIVQTDNSTGSDSGDINVLAPVSWSAHKLTLSAYRNINIRSTLSATGSSSLEMTSGSGGTIDYGLTASGFAGKVNFGARSGSGFLTINGNDYTVITSLGAAGSTSKTDLQGMSGDLLGKYYLGADINASSTSTWNSGAGFAPIGDFLDKFVGVFDGGGHTISGLTINRPTTNHVGLFGMTSGGKLGNLSLVNAGIIGNKFAGSLAGEVTNTQITKISATALVTIVDVDGTSAAGGLVASNSGTISNSYANGSVTGNTQSVNAGGLAGNNSGSISSSYANGSVLGIGDAGGLVGSNTGSISNSYATGNVTGNSSNPQFSAGGLVGKNNGSISSSYATGMVSGSRVGGLVGAKLVSGSTTTSYWDKDTSGMTTSVGGSGRTTTELMSGLPTGFSSDVWGIIPG